MIHFGKGMHRCALSLGSTTRSSPDVREGIEFVSRLLDAAGPRHAVVKPNPSQAERDNFLIGLLRIPCFGCACYRMNRLQMFPEVRCESPL